MNNLQQKQTKELFFILHNFSNFYLFKALVEETKSQYKILEILEEYSESTIHENIKYAKFRFSSKKYAGYDWDVYHSLGLAKLGLFVALNSRIEQYRGLIDRAEKIRNNLNNVN